MLTDEEYVAMVKKYLVIQPDGNIVLNITDPNDAEEYSAYIESIANQPDPGTSILADTNYGCGNNYKCKVQ